MGHHDEIGQLMVEEGAAVTYATINPADKWTNVLLSGGDLIATTNTASSGGMRATISKTTGKWYWEILWASTTTVGGTFGVATSAEPLNSNMINVYGWGYFMSAGQLYHNNTLVSGGHPVIAPNDVVSCAFDAGGGKLWYAVNGTWIGSGVPSTDTNPSFTGITGTIFPSLSSGTVDAIATCNFGASAFTYTVPSGFNSGVYE